MSHGFGRNAPLGAKYGPVIEIVSDPKRTVEDTADLHERIETGGVSRPTRWLQRLAGRRPSIDATALGNVPLYEGRACCFDHLRRFDGRTDLEFPFETECRGCQRVFRVTLGFTTPKPAGR